MKTVRPYLSTSVLAGFLAALLAACGGEATPAPASAGSTAGSGPEKAAPAGKGKKGAASALLAYQTGLQLLLKGEPEKSLAEFERATELDPQLGQAFFELGKLRIHLSTQNIGSSTRDLDVFDQGLAALEKARELEPANDLYCYWLGKSYYVRENREKALANLQKAVELNPKHALAWKTLGRVQKDAAQMKEARASFEKAIENAPSESGSYFQLGQTLEALEDLPAARAAYEKSIELNPREPEVLGRLTNVCARLGDAACEERARAGMQAWEEYDQALQRCRHAVNRNPNDPKALFRLGRMHFEVGRWEEAVAWFMRAIHIDPRDDRTHFYCGVARRQLKDYVNAANHLKEAEYLAPDNLDPKLELLRLYADTKEDASAKELIAKIEAEAAGESLWFLAEVCQEVGRAEDAARLFEKARAMGVTSSPELAGGETVPAEDQ